MFKPTDFELEMQENLSKRIKGLTKDSGLEYCPYRQIYFISQKKSIEIYDKNFEVKHYSLELESYDSERCLLLNNDFGLLYSYSKNKSDETINLLSIVEKPK